MGFASTPIGVVIVSYKTTKKTIEFINCELKKINLPVIIVVVNNTFTNLDNKKFLESLNASIVFSQKPIDKGAEVYLINSGDNLGFARGNNLGAKFLIENFSIDYILFVNNDIEILSPSLISKLVEKCTSDSRIGAIGPRMVDSNGTYVSPRYDRVTPFRYALQHLIFPVRKSQIFFEFNVKSPGIKELIKRKESEGFCYWVAGAFMLFKSKVFMEIGGFDEGTFLYGEEKIIAEKLREKNRYFYYSSTVTVLSDGGFTISRYFDSKAKQKMVYESDLYYYKKYFQIGSFMLWFLRFSAAIYFKVYHKILSFR